MPAQERTVQPTSQATPLGIRLVEELLGQLSSGAFGTGVGPLQRQAGGAASQFVASGGLPPELLAGAQMGFQRGLADVNESLGIAGSRLGTTALRTGGRAAEDFGIGLAAQGQQNLLQGINLLNQIATSSLAPFLAIGSQGIFPTQTTFTENPFISVLKGAGSLAGGIRGG